MPEASLEQPLHVWIVADGKPGHENQSRGLADALARQIPCELSVLPAQPVWRALIGLLLRRAAWTAALPAPDLIIGAGHATHLTLLAARRVRGGLSVAIMKPGLPLAWFDLCVIPEHDQVAASERVFVSVGALNRMHAVTSAPADRAAHGLLLIGGPSPHFVWDNAAVALQIDAILAHTPDIHWTLATSRRTPPDFVEHLSAHPRLAVVPHTATSANWLPDQLQRGATAWVTPDSASMVYEALSADAQVGVFDLAANPRSRIAHTIARLADAQRVTRFAYWCAYNRLHPKPAALAEADRCAAWIMEKLERDAH